VDFNARWVSYLSSGSWNNKGVLHDAFWFFDDVVCDRRATGWYRSADCMADKSLQKVTWFERKENEKH
jgi:hypothetical protein